MLCARRSTDWDVLVHHFVGHQHNSALSDSTVNSVPFNTLKQEVTAVIAQLLSDTLSLALMALRHVWITAPTYSFTPLSGSSLLILGNCATLDHNAMYG
jgi:hypothetical protein